jgi:hypothetical protein
MDMAPAWRLMTPTCALSSYGVLAAELKFGNKRGRVVSDQDRLEQHRGGQPAERTNAKSLRIPKEVALC